MLSAGLLERLGAGETLVLAEGYLFEAERRGYLQAGAFVPLVVLERPQLVTALYEEFAHAGSDIVLALTVRHLYPPFSNRMGDRTHKKGAAGIFQQRRTCSQQPHRTRAHCTLCNPANVYAEKREFTGGHFVPEVVLEHPDMVKGRLRSSHTPASISYSPSQKVMLDLLYYRDEGIKQDST